MIYLLIKFRLFHSELMFNYTILAFKLHRNISTLGIRIKIPTWFVFIG